MATHSVVDTSKRNISNGPPNLELESSTEKLPNSKILDVASPDDSGRLYDLAGGVENAPIVSLQEDPVPPRNGAEGLSPMHEVTTSDPNDPLYDEINEDGNTDRGDNHVLRGFEQEDQNSEDSTAHQRRVEPIIPLTTAISCSPDQALDDKYDVTHTSEVYDCVPDMVKNRAYSSNEAKNKKPRSCMHSCYAQLCFIMMFIAVAFFAIAAAILSAYNTYVIHTENTALREQLLQRNQMPLTAEDWERIREIIALECSRRVIKSLSPLREFNSSLASLSVQVDTLEEQQVTNTQTIDEQKMTLLELNERSTHFHNETEFQFAELTTELSENKARDQVLQEEVNSIAVKVSEVTEQLNYTQEQANELTTELSENKARDQVLQEEVNSLAVKVSEVTEQLNYTQEQANELNSTVHQLTEQVNQTRRAFEQLELQVTRDIGRLRLDINEVQTTLVGQFNSLRSSLESRLTQEVEVLEAAINRTETQVRADVDALSNQTQEKITSLEQGVDLTKELLLNQTQEIRSELSRELFEMRLDLNQTEERLTANIASVNSTLEEFALVGQESFTNLSVSLSTHRDLNGRDLQVVHANLSEQISINKADIRTQSENLISSERKLTAELAQLSLQSRNNFTQLEESLSNTNQDVSNVREDVQRVEGRMGDLESSQQHTSSDLRSLRFQVEQFHSTNHAAMSVSSTSWICLGAIVSVLVIGL